MEDILNSAWLIIALRIIIIFAITVIVEKIISHTFKKYRLSELINIKFIENIIRAVVWVIGITSIASQFSTFSKIASTVLAGSGIMAAIIGLAAQESFANIFSGLFISIFKPFNIGDRIRIVGDDTAGFVDDITLRHTIIRTYTNLRIIIPNSIIGSAKIENSTFSIGASYPIDVTIAYENKENRYKAMEIMEEIVTSHPLFYDNRSDEAKERGDKPSAALCSRLGESGIDLKILMWTESVVDNNKACSDCRLKILDRFEEEGIEIPYNKLVIYKDSLNT